MPQQQQPQQHQQLPAPNGNNLLSNQNLLFNSTWLPQQNTNAMLNVTPWIEQQAQVSPLVSSGATSNVINMQSLSMSSLSPNEASNFNIPPTPRSHSDEEIKLKSDQDKDSKTNSVAPPPPPSHQAANASPTKETTSTTNDPTEINDNNNNNDDEDLIPTAIVIKNIPFAIKKEQLLDVMTKLNLPLPYAFNYHFDNGVFRGLAFANFTSTDETTLVVTQLNGREIGGRKIRVEYKKMLPVQERERIEREKREKRGQLEEQHRSTSATSLASLYSISSNTNNNGVKQPQGPANNGSINNVASDRLYANLTGQAPPSNLDFNDPETFELYSQLLLFRDDREKVYNELAYPSTLSQNQRKIIPLLLNFMKLSDSYENGLIVIRRKMANSPNQPYLQQQQHPLLRSQSHSSLGMLSQLTQSLQNSRYRNSPGVQVPPSLNNVPPLQLSPQQQMKANFMNKSSSNLASLRTPSNIQSQPQQQNSNQQPQQLNHNSPYGQPSNGFLSQSMMMPQSQYQPMMNHHTSQSQFPQQQQQQQSFGFMVQPSLSQNSHKTYLDDSLIASVENLTFN